MYFTLFFLLMVKMEKDLTFEIILNYIFKGNAGYSQFENN